MLEGLKTSITGFVTGLIQSRGALLAKIAAGIVVVAALIVAGAIFKGCLSC